MLWICNDCTAAYSVGAPNCPQCGADNHRDEGTDLPKVKPAKKNPVGTGGGGE